jgi:hypothetical protein
MRDPFYTYGPPRLCAWQVEKLGEGEGIFWFQTTDKVFSRKLSKRLDTRYVEVAGWNYFRRTYEMRGNWRKVKRIINNYILSAGDQFSGANRPLNKPKIAFLTFRRPSPPNVTSLAK